MKLKTANKMIIFSIFASAFMLQVSFAVEVSKKDLEIMEKKVQQQNAEHQRLQEQAMQINQELEGVSQEMVKSAKLIQNNEEKISQMEETLEKLQQGLVNAENTFLKEDENLIKTLSALQNLALKPTEALFVQPLTPVEIIRSAMLLRETVPYLEQNAELIRTELEKIEKKKNLVEKQVQKITQQKQLLENEHEQMKLLVQKKSKIRNAVEIKSEQTKKEVDKLASQAQDVRDLLQKLDAERKEKKRRQQEELKRLAEIRRQEQEKLSEAKKLEEQERADLIKFKPEIIKEVGDNFVSAKGQLSMPAKGPIVTAYGEERVKGVSSKGIIIKTRNMAQVISPYDGAVIFAGPFRGYGNLIIIEHGSGYLSLLAGLENIDCEIGQMLLAGEPVGQMPDDRDAKLYVELRKDNQPINPMLWMRN